MLHLHFLEKISRYVRFRTGLLIAGLIATTCYSCREKGSKNIDQGEIHYSIDYVDYFGPMPKEFMPKNLIVSFKKNKILSEMLSPIGNSGIMNLTNPELEIYDTYISMLTIREFYAAEPGEIFPGFEGMRGMEVRKTLRTNIICGLSCKNAEVTFPFDRRKVYNIWYTNEIKVQNPNAGTPFNQIDGVLMRFCFFLGHAELHFDAETIYKKEIPDKTFERREKFVRVSRENIDKFINRMISI